MQFRSFLNGPRNLSIAKVMEIDENGNYRDLGYEVYEGRNCISELVSLANAVGIVHQMVRELDQQKANEDEPDISGSKPGGP